MAQHWGSPTEFTRAAEKGFQKSIISQKAETKSQDLESTKKSTVKKFANKVKGTKVVWTKNLFTLTQLETL